MYRLTVQNQNIFMLLHRATALLPLWAVRPVQSLSACTRGALYFFLLYSPEL